MSAAKSRRRRTPVMVELAAARCRAGLSQRVLARHLGRAHSFIAKIESGERRVTVDEFCTIAQALAVDPRELLTQVLNTQRNGEFHAT